jgi:hypothetical protein
MEGKWERNSEMNIESESKSWVTSHSVAVSVFGSL